MKLPILGENKVEINMEWPTTEDLRKFPLSKRIKLEQISYQDSALHKIKLHFLQGVETPMLNCSTPSGKAK